MRTIKKTAINRALLLDSSCFSHQEDDIDHLIKQAANTLNSKEALSYLTLAASHCEKFHSYFHYEESYIHSLIGQLEEREGNLDKAIEQYKASIKLYPLNQSAYLMLAKCLERDGDAVGLNELQERASLLGLKIINVESIPRLRRPFEKFSEYIKFATGAEHQDLLPPEWENNFWLHLDLFHNNNDKHHLERAITLAKENHKAYHYNAGLIYFNCAQIYNNLGKIELAKNAMVKCHNLDPSIV